MQVMYMYIHVLYFPEYKLHQSIRAHLQCTWFVHESYCVYSGKLQSEECNRGIMYCIWSTTGLDTRMRIQRMQVQR